MTFGVLTINHRRPQVLHLFLASMKRLRKDVGIDFPVVCVSGVEDRKVCANYGVTHVVYANNPASAKWNIGMVVLQKLHLDYVIILGSDDIMSTDTLKNMMAEMENGWDLIGLTDIYVYDGDGKTRGGLIHYETTKVLGVGKCVNKRVLDEVGWRPWHYHRPRNFGMDAIFSRNTNPHVKTLAKVQGVIVDVKSKDSLNKFTMFVANHKGYMVDNKIFFDILGEEEKELLKNI